MTHRYQFLDRNKKPLNLADVDDDICRDVLGRQADREHFSFEFNFVSLAVSTFDYNLESLLRDIDSPIFSMTSVQDRDTFAAALEYLIRRGITTRAWVEPNRRSWRVRM